MYGRAEGGTYGRAASGAAHRHCAVLPRAYRAITLTLRVVSGAEGIGCACGRRWQFV